ncbi:molybdopterin-dependent oxidoreductase [Iamia sp. SCSIO 61187]|uniref:2Fe-2S iron-sulfur cluster-binding protein n=1 Tax=Iamia sp. SCSIO 61187 TaxID=2722752 RepID=UPI001C634FDC|nr:2Fe-2S iron-sulfur cluster-binding protein [Iamia sp. SCSIO 61187]QYG94726.1 molybdopterin-dependent oxidoreductase [Iamia sp. SCSIO 61187]
MTDPAPSSQPPASTVALEVDGRPVEVADDGITLLDALRDHLGVRSAKDGCSPQGQCGCCTVLVDGSPRVACVTPLRRVAGRRITTVDGLDPDVAAAWADAFAATGASQCGFCTPGIICRLEGARAKGVAPDDEAGVDRALAAHLCRCTGWRPIHDAYAAVAAPTGPSARPAGPDRDLDAASRRAGIEGHAPQTVGPEVALGRGGFADDSAPADALVAVPDGRGGWIVAETLAAARRQAGKVQGRRTTVDPVPPLDLPAGEWAATLRTCWVEPAYLEPDAAWCAPGGDPVGPLVNGGAFGGKRSSPVASAARALADRHDRPVRVLLAREDVVRLGPKRPPVAGGVRPDGTGVLRIVATPGVAAAVARVAPGLVVEEVETAGPPTDAGLRAAGWAEAALLLAAVARPGPVTGPDGGEAEATIAADGSVRVRVSAGDPLDPVVLRSFCIGAAHQALSWIRSEGLAVTPDGVIEDLTIRSFGILKASEMPPVEVEVVASDRPPVNGSDAVFVAVATAAWLAAGAPTDLPTGLP